MHRESWHRNVCRLEADTARFTDGHRERRLEERRRTVCNHECEEKTASPARRHRVVAIYITSQASSSGDPPTAYTRMLSRTRLGTLEQGRALVAENLCERFRLFKLKHIICKIRINLQVKISTGDVSSSIRRSRCCQ